MTDFVTNRERLDYIIEQNAKIIEQNETIISLSASNVSIGVREMQELDDLEAEVSSMKTAGEAMGAQIDFSVNLMDKIKGMLDAALAAPQVDKAKLVALRDLVHNSSTALDAKKDDLKAAADRDTPFDPSANA